MIQGTPYPLTCCSWDCAEANGCHVGGAKCIICECFFCPVEGGEYVGGHFFCDECNRKTDEGGEDGEDEK